MASNRNKKNKSGNQEQNQQGPPRMFCIRFTLFFLVVALTGVSVFFGYSLKTLYDQVQSDTATIESLQSQVASQKTIIDRFNTSITNADLEKDVQSLNQTLRQTEAGMKQAMHDQFQSIQISLNKTLKELDQTVTAAEAEIHYEVGLVKSDVQQYVRTTQDQFSMENHFMTFQLAGTFCLLAILISMWHMTAHIREFKRPFVQRKILAILWMSPIYAVTSWLSLVFPKFEGYLAIIKDFYEAYVIYQFLGFCISVLGKGDREEVVDLLAKHTDHLDPPMRMCGWCRGEYSYSSPEALARAVLLQCQIFAMQFVFFKPLTAVGLFSCQKFENLCTVPDDHHFILWGVVPVHLIESPVLWLKVIQNISVFMAFSGLLKFYHAVQDELAWCNPFPKFLCIKGIVFMTFWQGLVISLLATTTESNNQNEAVLDGGQGNNEDPDLWAKQAQNFLICLEMLLFSIAHFFCFPTDEWQEGYRPIMEKKIKGLGDNMAFGDFVADLKLILRGSDSKEKKKKALEKKNDDLDLKGDDNNDDDFKDGGNAGAPSANDKDIEKGDSSNDEANNNETQGKSNDTDNGDQGDKNESMISEDDALDEETMDTLLTESLRKSLSARNEEVREAAHRLLRNRMVEVDRISERSGSRSGSESSMKKSSTDDPEPDYGALAVDDKFHSEYESMAPMGGGDDAAPTETTGLLAKSGDDGKERTANKSKLRPSIFTKVGKSMGAMNNFG